MQSMPPNRRADPNQVRSLRLRFLPCEDGQRHQDSRHFHSSAPWSGNSLVRESKEESGERD